MQIQVKLAFFLFIISLYPARAQELDGKMWVTDGVVHTIARSGNAVYLGGTFNYVGPNTGGGALLDPVAGKLSPKPLLQVNGMVRTSIPDGQGGWFIAGTFTHVQGVPCVSVAHLLPNGRVDPDWNLNPQYHHGFFWDNVQTGEIHTLALHKGTLYVGGYFQRIGGADRKMLAAVDVATRKVKPWT
ncbi:MAG: delta-60 repeat domain-containing protein, partial [Cytophagales bacterium]|nr:delta-60 repeat domain-containing protein [Cytophagales bacterium]